MDLNLMLLLLLKLLCNLLFLSTQLEVVLLFLHRAHRHQSTVGVKPDQTGVHQILDLSFDLLDLVHLGLHGLHLLLQLFNLGQLADDVRLLHGVGSLGFLDLGLGTSAFGADLEEVV